MSVLDEEYLKNTRKVYNDFCNQADNYRTSKDFIIQTYKFVIPFIIGMIWTVVVFLMINWNYIGKY
ncbi:Uncharacterised protein [Streptococcus pneumoniae]|nr:Uncharacterised protein [Streptococcus pneumoniae]